MCLSRKTITLEVESDGQEVLVRSYHAMVLEMSDLARTAPEGRVIDQLEDAVIEKGRDILRGTLERAVQERIDDAEKKGLRSGTAHVDRNARPAARRRGNS